MTVQTLSLLIGDNCLGMTPAPAPHPPSTDKSKDLLEPESGFRKLTGCAYSTAINQVSKHRNRPKQNQNLKIKTFYRS